VSTIALVSFGITTNTTQTSKKEVVRQECSQCKFQSRESGLGEVIGFSSCPAVGAFSGMTTPPTEQQRALFLDGQFRMQGEEGAVDSMMQLRVLGRGGCRTFFGPCSDICFFFFFFFH